MIDWIDQASLVQLLQTWRLGKVGDPFFTGEVGEHYREVMFSKRDGNPKEWASASKTVGW